MAVAWYNLVFQIVNVVTGLRVLLWVGATTVTQPDMGEAILPVGQAWLMWSLYLVPFGLNFLLGRWGGRRVLLSVPLAYLPLLALPMLTPIESTRVFFTVAGIKLNFPYLILFFVVIATAGAWAGSFWQRRQRWALVGGASLENASSRLRKYQRGYWLRASTCIILAGVIGFAAFTVVKKRINEVLHPPTPEAAVRVMLSDPGMNFNEMEPATNVSTRVLPATPEELKNGERHVAYTATMHATESYRQKRIAYLQKNLRASLAGDNNAYDAKSCRLSLARLKPEGYQISRVVRVEKTPQDWEVQDGAKSSVYAWLYDVYYER